LYRNTTSARKLNNFIGIKMIKLELSIDEVNIILRTLGKHPFDEVVMLISKIKDQGEPQALEIAKQLEAAKAETTAE
jgi:hypothetical protein